MKIAISYMNYYLAILFVFSLSLSYGQNIITESDPSVTTDKLTSGGLVIGINGYAGGVINYLEIPGVGNIFGPQSIKYGRSGQSAMRDGLHGGRYNPTQAGFNETLGTPCIIEKGEGKYVLPARNLALWYGDCEWDFCEWENIGADASCYADGGHGDVDQLDESNLPGKQDTEVRSEFDYFGLYHDYKDKGNIGISCVRHYFEYRYAREPGHCISQFRPGLDIYKPALLHPDISTAFPQGLHPAEPFDMSNYILSWHIRNDVANWVPKYQFISKTEGNWTIQDRDVYVTETLDGNGKVVTPRLLIISDSNNPDTDNALGFYMPESEFNMHETIGVDETTGLIDYKDRRYKSIRIWDQPQRIPTMGLYGFKVETKGLLNRTRLPQNIYEAYRFDVFILMGTPNEIWDAVNKIENAVTLWNFTSDLEDWTTSGGTAHINEEALQLTNPNGDALLLSPDNLLVDADLHKMVSFRLKNNTPGTTAELNFKKYGSTDFLKHSITIQSNTDTWQTYTINVSALADWDGMIRQVGLSFPGATGAIDLDYVAVAADNLVDCNGEFGGTAFIDECSTCVGGNTGKQPCTDCMGVSNGEAVLNGCGQCVGGTSPLPLNNEWHFDDLNDWTLNARITGTASNSIASLSVTGADPFLTFNEGVCLNSEVYKILKLKLKNNTDGTEARLYFQNSTTNIWKSIPIVVSQNDSQIKTYTVDFSGEQDWVGDIRKVRFDPPGSSGTLELDYLGITKDGIITGINDFADKNVNAGISLFPNPATNKFYVETQTASDITVFDSRGVMVYRNDSPELKHTIDTENWNSGLYFVKMTNSNGSQFAKCLIIK